MFKSVVLPHVFARAFARRVSRLSWSSGASALAIIVGLSIGASTAIAQETAGEMNGQILGTDGSPVAGAQIRIVHTPSGTTTTSTTNADGRFLSRGLRLGGPYEVTVSAPGQQPEKVQADIFVSLGDAFALDYQLGTRIEEVVVSTQRQREMQIGGTTSFSLEQITSAPTATRDLKDIVRLDPKVYVDRFNQDAIQITGTNNRFNLLTIDGVRQNDDFGLNNNGYPALRSPLSLDAIEQLSMNTAPFAVTYSGFQGGNVNVVTKSGTNQFHGSAYFYYGSSDLLGSQSGNRAITGFDFKDKTWGATLGGPIVQDRLFFFGGFEKFTTSNPVTRGPLGAGFSNEVPQVTQADFTQIAQIAQSVYGYDILGFPKTLPETDQKIFGKLSWNVNDDHRVIVSYNRDKGNSVINPAPSTLTTSLGSLGAGSNWYNNTQKVDSLSAQVFSDWTDAFKTELKYSYKKQTASALPLGQMPFAEMQIRTPAGGLLAIGPDRFRHLNSLDSKVQTIKAKADYLLNDHTFTAGFEREMMSVFNAFVQDSMGAYLFNSIADFQSRTAQQLVYANSVTNIAADAAARFKSNTNTFYVQDSWKATADLTVVAGLRYDRFDSPSVPRNNNTFNTRYGFPNTFTYDGRGSWQPRLSATYKVDPITTVRAGFGLFSGGSPNVWLSNSFTNDGVGTGNATITRGTSSAALTTAALNNVNGQVPAAVKALLVPGDGSVNAVDPNFQVPSIWKLNLGIDRTFDLGALGDDYVFNAEMIYGRVKDAVLWRELRIVQTGTGPDGRPIYGRRPGVPAAGNDLLLTNTDQGSSFTVSAMVSKNWDTKVGKFDLQIGYAYNRAKEVNPGTSSLAQSNWDNLATSDINNPALTTSNYEMRHNVTVAAQWSKPLLFDDYNTTVSLFGNGRSGRPLSYTFAGTSAVFGDPRQASRQRQLFYVPRDANDVVLTGGLQWDTLNQYIIENGLDKYRGQIAPRNAFRSSPVGVIDLRIAQEIPAFFPSGAKGQFSMDIRNLTNLINSSWGRMSQFDFPFVIPVVEATGISPNGRYIYSGPIRAQNRTVQARQSVWAIVFGVRYEF